MITSSIERAQKKGEENNFGIRKRWLEYDDVMNSQREVVYKRRKHALFGERLTLDIDNMFYDLCATACENNHSMKQYENYRMDLLRMFGIDAPLSAEDFGRMKLDDVIHPTYAAVIEKYNQKIQTIRAEAFPVIKNIYENNTQGYTNVAVPFSDLRKTIQVGVNLERAYHSQGMEIIDALQKGITLAIIDHNWKQHLRDMDDLRSNVQFASHEQKDPLLIYKLESFNLFRNLLYRMNSELAAFLMHASLPQTQPQPMRQAAPRAEQPRVNTSKAESMNLQQRVAATSLPSQPPMGPPLKVEPIRVEKTVGRNEPCPCGSGKKFKACHGAAEN